jgi:PKD repeat protein
MCALPDSGDYVWSPSVGLSNDNVQRPSVSTTESRWYSVDDAVSGFIDSIYVNVIPLTLSVGSAYNDLLCGQQTGLVATYHAGATYSWHPSDGLSSTTSSSVVASPLDTTTYYVTVNVPGCGSITDSASVRVNPLPTAYLYIDSLDHNFFQFLNASACADTYYWDFGDSTSSTDEHPAHFFPDSGGTFLITLIACNSFGCDTFQGTIYFEGIIDGVGPTEQPESFKLFPNPTTDDVTISFTQSDKDVEVRVFNGSGQCVYTAIRKSSERVFIDLPALPNGQYSLSIFDGKLHRAKKLIIAH